MKRLWVYLLIGLWLVGCQSAWGVDFYPAIPSATTSRAGKVELATDAETVTGSATDKATTPANVKAALTNTGYDVGIGSTTAGKNLTVNATRTSIFTFDEANVNEDDVTWTMTGTGALVHVTGNTTTLTATTTEAIVAGTTYRVTITGTGSGGTATYTLGGVAGTTIAASGAIAIEDYITASTTGAFIITPATGCTVSITSITIEKLPDATGDLTVGGNAIFRSPITLEANASILSKATGTGFTTYDGSNPYLNVIVGRTSRFTLMNGVLNIVSDIGSLKIGVNADTTLTRDAANTLAQRNSTNQQIYRCYNTYTDASNYERASLTGVAGASINLTAETAGTGSDNLDIVLTPAGTGAVKFKEDSVNVSATANTGGGLARRIAEATADIEADASTTIAVNVPSGARILGCQLRVDTALTDTELWDAAYAGGSTQAIATAQAVAKNTKVNTMFNTNGATDIASDTTTIVITKNGGGNFTAAGTIRAIVYYEDFIALSDNP